MLRLELGNEVPADIKAMEIQLDDNKMQINVSVRTYTVKQRIFPNVYLYSLFK